MERAVLCLYTLHFIQITTAENAGILNKLDNICLQNETVDPKSQKVLPLQSAIKG